MARRRIVTAHLKNRQERISTQTPCRPLKGYPGIDYTSAPPSVEILRILDLVSENTLVTIRIEGSGTFLSCLGAFSFRLGITLWTEWMVTTSGHHRQGAALSWQKEGLRRQCASLASEKWNRLTLSAMSWDAPRGIYLPYSASKCSVHVSVCI